MSAQCGALSALAAILKHGDREDLIPHGAELLHWLTNGNYRKRDVPLIRQLGMKVVQRIGKLNPQKGFLCRCLAYFVCNLFFLSSCRLDVFENASGSLAVRPRLPFFNSKFKCW